MNQELRRLVEDCKNVHTGMAEDESKGQYAVWKNKKVYDGKTLFAFDSMENISIEMCGKLDITSEQTFNGHDTLRLTRSNLDDRGTSFSFTSWPGNSAVIHLNTHYEDFSKYNRISMWVYADAPTRPNTWIYFVMCNKENGSIDMHGLDCRTGFNVPSNQWFQVFWEFDTYARDAVREFVMVHESEGICPGDDPQVKLYFSDLRIEKVDADAVHGWDLRERIAYNQTGFTLEGPKKAVAQNVDGKEFCLIDCQTGNIVYTGCCKTLREDIGEFQVMDFSDLNEEGTYVLTVAGRQTHPFRISDDVYASPLFKLINFFERERCGVEVPGTHGPCGMSDYLVHPDTGKILSNSGGWHDAGDLCQELCTSCDAITAMLELIENLGTKEPELKERTLEEVRHGLDWVVKSTFRDGYYAFGSGHMNWDDFAVEPPKPQQGIFRMVEKGALGHWFRAAVLARASKVFRRVDPWFSRLCCKEATEDFDFGLEAAKTETVYEERRGNTATHELQQLSRKGHAAVELYIVTKDAKYLEYAAECVKLVGECQQQDMPAWEKPLRGFFYTSRQKTLFAEYEHQSAEQAPIVFLTRFLDAAPEHEAAYQAKHICELYAEYITSTMDVIKPYGLLPAAIYKNDLMPRKQMMDMEGGQYVVDYFKSSIENGIRLDDGIYLRRLPVSSTVLKGFFAPIYAKAWAVGEIARIFNDKKLADIAIDQLGFIFGKNPFARSDMYGEGYGYQPLYTPYSLDMVGAVPVGIQTFEDRDEPFYPSNNRPTFNEVWIHSASRVFGTLASVITWIK